jgi:hypothetical protein
MEGVALLPILLAIFISVPLMTGWVAKAEGRSFWLWAVLTCILPGFTMVALFILPQKNKTINFTK